MEWLSQNWFWLVFAVAMVVMLRRGGAGGCCGGGHIKEDKRAEADGAPTTNKIATAGGCCGGHGAGDKHHEVAGSQNVAAGAGHQH